MNNATPSLDRLIRLAQKRPNLLAAPLALYQDEEGLDDQHFAAILGCPVEALSRLALCECPRPVPHFRADVERIASYIQIDVIQLALVIRAAEAREALYVRDKASSCRLQVARDHEDGALQ
jgi:hypothetical protein